MKGYVWILLAKVPIHVLLPLLFGGVIYIAYRPLSLYMFEWFDFFSVNQITSSIRCFLAPYQMYFSEWIIYSLPNGLWVYSFSSLFFFIWDDSFHKVKYWLIIPLMLGAGAEIFQYLKLIPGTFDVIDFLICIFALWISVILNKKNDKNEKEFF